MSDDAQMSFEELVAGDPGPEQQAGATVLGESVVAETDAGPMPDAIPPRRGFEPTEAQREAIEAREPFVFAEAGAGCGKTGVLVERYCDAICESERGVDSVLAFTFTEKAAAELRLRIRRELRGRARRAAEQAEAEQARHLTELARAPGSWVTTIHGFCRRLIAAHPIAAGVDPAFGVLEQSQASDLADRAFEEAFEVFLADPTPARLARATQWRPGLRDGVRFAHEALRSLGQVRPALPDPPPPALREALIELGEAAAVALEATEEAGSSKWAKLNRERFADAVAIADRARGATGDDDPGLPGSTELEALCKGGNAKIFDCPEVEAYTRALDHAISRTQIPAYDAFRDLLLAYGEAYSRMKEERSVLDFEDLQLIAVSMLEERPVVRAIYQERFAHILVDEYQDTNTLQTRLISLLRGEDTRVFTVGDEFQSIYGFRNADIEIFRAEREKADRRVRLAGNFRSVEAVIDAVNAFGNRDLADFAELDAAADNPGNEKAGLPVDQPEVELLLLPAGGWDGEEVGLDADDRIDGRFERVAEAAALAARLGELVDEGVPMGEIVVLMRAFTHVAPYEEALARAGLRPLVIGGRGYWSHQQVEDMRAILGVIDNPLDDLRLFGALSSPAGGVSPDTLWLLRRGSGSGHVWPTLARNFGEPAGSEPGGGGSEVTADAPIETEDDEEARAAAERQRERDEAIAAIYPEEAEKLRAFVATVEDLRSRAGLDPLDQTVEGAANALGYDLATLMRPGGQRRWANVRKLMNMARTYEQGEGRNLRGFLASIDARVERDEAEPEAATEAEGHDGVRIMTIHNAKGLEFGVVAFANAGRRLSEGSGNATLLVSQEPGAEELRAGLTLARSGRSSLKLFDYQQLADEAKQAECAEELRLAYVAMTRAQRRLIISGTFGTTKDGRSGRSETTSVLDRLCDLAGIGFGRTDPDREETAFAGWEAAGAETVGQDPVVARIESGQNSFRLAARCFTPEPGAGRRLLDALSSHERGGDRSTGEFDPDAIGPLALTGAQAVVDPQPGQLSASALETFDQCGYRFYAQRRLGLEARAADSEPRQGEGGAPDALRFGSAVHTLLEWSARNRWRPPTRGRAVDLLGHEPSADRALEMVEGWLASDLAGELQERGVRLSPEAPFLHAAGGAMIRGNIDLLASPIDGAPVIVDYKTNRLDGGDPAERMTGYATQRDIYALAVSGSGNGSAGSAEGVLVRTAFVFLEDPASPVLTDYDAAELAAARERVEERIAAIAEERFEVTDAPNLHTCRGCPVEGTLCPHPRELTRRLP